MPPARRDETSLELTTVLTTNTSITQDASALAGIGAEHGEFTEEASNGTGCEDAISSEISQEGVSKPQSSVTTTNGEHNRSVLPGADDELSNEEPNNSSMHRDSSGLGSHTRPVAAPQLPVNFNNSESRDPIHPQPTPTLAKRCVNVFDKWTKYLLAIFRLIVATVALWPTFVAKDEGNLADEYAAWTAKKDFLEFCADKVRSICAFGLLLLLPRFELTNDYRYSDKRTRVANSFAIRLFRRLRTSLIMRSERLGPPSALRV